MSGRTANTLAALGCYAAAFFTLCYSPLAAFTLRDRVAFMLAQAIMFAVLAVAYRPSAKATA